jgi:hypothetical protein
MANKGKKPKSKNLRKGGHIISLPILKNIEYDPKDVTIALSTPILLGLPNKFESGSENLTSQMLQFVATAFGMITDLYEDSNLYDIIEGIVIEDTKALPPHDLSKLREDRRALINRSEEFFYKNLESRLRGTIIRLLIESIFAGIDKPIPKKVQDAILYIDEASHREKLMARGRGGDNRQAEHLWDEEEYKRFAKKVTKSNHMRLAQTGSL